MEEGAERAEEGRRGDLLAALGFLAPEGEGVGVEVHAAEDVGELLGVDAAGVGGVALAPGRAGAAVDLRGRRGWREGEEVTVCGRSSGKPRIEGPVA